MGSGTGSSKEADDGREAKEAFGVFVKRLDKSAVSYGVAVPRGFRETLLAHLTVDLQPGNSHHVSISIGGKSYGAFISHVAFSNPKMKPCLQIVWLSELKQLIQATFPDAYSRLLKDPKDKDWITDSLTISCGEQPDLFLMDFSRQEAISNTSNHEDSMKKDTHTADKKSQEFQKFTDKCSKILDENFANGFRLNSPIEVKRFRSFWENKYSKECGWDDSDIQKAMRLVGVEFNERVYAPRQLAPQEVFNELKAYIEQLFAEGKPVIYYQALLDEFNRRGIDWKINSPEMLKSFLVANACPYSLRRSCIAIDHDVEVSPVSEIRDYLREQPEPVGYDKLQAALPHLPLDVIKHELATNTEFVNSARGEYMHADIVDLSESDLNLIANMIQTEIHSKGYMTGTELWEKLEMELPEYANRFSHLPLVGFRDSLKHKFVGRFNFQGEIISSVEEPIHMAGIFAGFCKCRNAFSMEDLERLREDINAPGIYFEPVYENSIRVSQKDFVSPSSVTFDVDAVDEAIGRFCRGEFIAIADITSFAAFPVMQVQWTSYLVESFVSQYSKRFKLLHNQYNATVCVGAIVRANAKLHDYDQVLATVLARASCNLDSATALDYLCNAGFLGRRRYTNIDSVLSEARRIRTLKR